jgi:predicted metalloprotease with PDZ domain
MLRERLDGHGPGAPLDGLERGGWQVVYGDEPTEAIRATDDANEVDGFLFSLGLALERSGNVAEVYWGGPAFAAGLAPRMTVLAVDGRAYSPQLLREAITAARSDASRRIDLLVRKGDTFQTVSLDYHGGLRYPRLERIPGREDRLSAILAPRTSPARARN